MYEDDMTDFWRLVPPSPFSTPPVSNTLAQIYLFKGKVPKTTWGEGTIGRESTKPNSNKGGGNAARNQSKGSPKGRCQKQHGTWGKGIIGRESTKPNLNKGEGGECCQKPVQMEGAKTNRGRGYQNPHQTQTRGKSPL